MDLHGKFFLVVRVWEIGVLVEHRVVASGATNFACFKMITTALFDEVVNMMRKVMVKIIIHIIVNILMKLLRHSSKYWWLMC